jgi:hypothetical protein
MNLDTPKACNLLGLVYFMLVTMIEVLMFCTVFNAFTGSWIRIASIMAAIISFNAALWYFALAYHTTLTKLKKTQ